MQKSNPQWYGVDRRKRKGVKNMMWNYGFGGFFPGFFWILILVLFCSFFWGRGHHHWHGHDHNEEDKSPQDILADRFARGEIDETEYKKRLEVLKKHKA